MKRLAVTVIVLMGALLAPTESFAQISCSREGLQRAVDLYIAAQSKGDTSGLPLPTGVGYVENMAPANINTGLIKTAMKIDHHRSLLDPVIVPDVHRSDRHEQGEAVRPRHAAARQSRQDRRDRDPVDDDGLLAVQRRRLLEVVVHGEVGRHSRRQRDTRDTLVAAANAYLDAFLEGKKDLVPWGYPCNRTEGGAHTGNGSPTDSCDVGVPSGVNIANRRFVVDETIGSVVVFCTFGAGSAGGGSGAPDTHLFRVENGKLRYVHTLTHLLQSNFRGRRGRRPGTGGGERWRAADPQK